MTLGFYASKRYKQLWLSLSTIKEYCQSSSSTTISVVNNNGFALMLVIFLSTIIKKKILHVFLLFDNISNHSY